MQHFIDSAFLNFSGCAVGNPFFTPQSWIRIFTSALLSYVLVFETNEESLSVGIHQPLYSDLATLNHNYFLFIIIYMHNKRRLILSCSENKVLS
jgi:hypothetical protein